MLITRDAKALKIGETIIYATVLAKERGGVIPFPAEVYKGHLKVEIKSPYNVTIDNGTTFACVGSILTYRVNGLLNDPGTEEIIQWSCSETGKLISEQGKTPAQFKVLGTGFFNVTAKITSNGQVFTAQADKEVWVGKPTVDSNVQTEHTIEAGDEIILNINEFNHYTGDIEYRMETGMQEWVEIEQLSGTKFKIKSNHPQIFTDTIIIKFLASNVCGTVANSHTIHVEAGEGSGFNKAIFIMEVEQHSFFRNPSYKLEKYAGDTQNFKLYTTFTLNHKADLRYIAAYIGEIEYQPFKIYDEAEQEIYDCPSDKEPLQIIEMKPGKYYLVVDVQSNPDDAQLTVGIEGEVKGSYPQSPYIVDVDEQGFEFSDQRDTVYNNQSFYYLDASGNEIRTTGRNNIYYVMKLEQPMQILLHTTGSEVCTELHIMDGVPYSWKVLYHDEGGVDLEEIKQDLDMPQYVKDNLWGAQTCIKKIFEAGEYKLVFNGIKKSNGSKNNGVLRVNISGRKIKGQSFDDAYELGSFGDEREFRLEQVYHDIQSHLRHGVAKLYYHFSFRKNINLSGFAKSTANFYPPIQLYNAQRELIASSDSYSCVLADAMGGDYYMAVDLQDMKEDSFTLTVDGRFRGGSPEYDAYNIGTYDGSFTFVDDMDTTKTGFHEFFRYKDENGDYPYITPEAKHIYYKVILLCDMKLSITTNENSKVSPEIHIMEGEPMDWKVLYHSMFTAEVNLYAGKYYLVFNGKKMTNGGEWNGLINVNITGTPL